jgi:hypothetical protein
MLNSELLKYIIFAAMQSLVSFKDLMLAIRWPFYNSLLFEIGEIWPKFLCEARV